MHPRPSRHRNCERPTGGERPGADHYAQQQNEAWIMRILAAALGALLISTSQPALALGGHEQGELQQAEAQQTEPQQAEAPAAETQPAEAPQPSMQQAETLTAETPQPDMQQAETQPAEAPQPDMRQAETQPAEAPQPDMRQAETQQAEATQGVAPLGEPQQPQMRQAAAPDAEPLQGAFAAVPQAGLPRDVKWTVFAEMKYGTRLDVPSAVFATPDGPADRGIGRQFKTPDGRASLAVYSQSNDARDTPASYLRKNLQSSRAALAYERVTPEFFAIAAVMRGSIYYSRCNFSHNAGRAIHCFDLKYPVQERQSWDGIVTRMSRSLRPLQGG
jgi:outer membrane biosynthesis protein TonB